MGEWFDLEEGDDELLSEESAKKAVKELLQYYHVSVKDIPDKKSKEAVEASVRKLVTYYRRGVFENVREGTVLRVRHNLQEPMGAVNQIVYERMSGKAKLATDGFDVNDRYARIFAMLDFLTGMPKDTLATGMCPADLSAAEDLGVLFLLG